jgi:hypothetical protein
MSTEFGGILVLGGTAFSHRRQLVTKKTVQTLARRKLMHSNVDAGSNLQPLYAGAWLESTPSLTAFFSHVGHVVFPRFNA